MLYFRSFNLHLQPHVALFAPLAQAIVVNARNEHESVDIDTGAFYIGHLTGTPTHTNYVEHVYMWVYVCGNLVLF